jgi:CubicO group peptidase (beta-lactamase class C family)
MTAFTSMPGGDLAPVDPLADLRRFLRLHTSESDAPERTMHGLVSTTTDYLRFYQMLLDGGELDGVRLLGRKTVELMTMNHLPDSMIPIGWPPDIMPGYGFGLGFRVRVDDAQAGLLGSVGEYAWGGYASTSFFVDPKEELIALLMPQFLPSGYYPILEEFRVLVYQALVD